MEDTMTDAPKSMDEQLQKRAYALWEQEGKPEGRADEHWRQARSELEAAGQATETAVSLGTAKQVLASVLPGHKE